jgi:aspartyl-tRNA(Asn)/glutamyl-tRNA(Gln) amidotransferase subunit B
VRLKGEKKLGTKVEVKNLNSIRNVKRAIDFEAKRLVTLIEHGEVIEQQTRSFDAADGTTFALRTKEDANDYRYFADPDLVPFHITDSFLEAVRETIPALPEELIAKYTQVLMLPIYDATVLCDDRKTADYFGQLIKSTTNYKAAANWILGPVKSWLNEHDSSIDHFPLAPASLAQLIQLVDDGKVNFSIASTRIFPILIAEEGRQPLDIAVQLNLIQESDSNQVLNWVEEVLAKMPDKVLEYRKGKKALIGLFIGEVKKVSKGKADPQLTSRLLLEKLNA